MRTFRPFGIFRVLQTLVLAFALLVEVGGVPPATARVAAEPSPIPHGNGTDNVPLSEWTRQFGSASWDKARGVAAGPTGEVYVVGDIHGALPGQTLTGYTDAFVRKYDSSGNETWTRQFGMMNQVETAFGVALGPQGEVYVAGRIEKQLYSSGEVIPGVFLRKYDSNGVQIWVREFGQAGLDGSTDDYDGVYFSGEQATCVAVGLQGEIYIAGRTIYSGSAYRVLLRKYDSDGNVLWTRQFGVANNDFANGVAVGPQGEVYLAGQTTGAFPGQTNQGLWDAFVMKCDSSGNEVWVRQFGTLGYDYAYGVASGPNGEVYVASQIAISAGSVPESAEVRKYDSGGNVLWTRQFNASGQKSAANGAAVGPQGEVYLAGTTRGAFPGQVSAGVYDAFVRSYDSAGSELWTRQFGSAGDDSTQGVAVGPQGQVFVAGYTGGALPGQTSAGSSDAFVSMLVQPPADHIVVSPASAAVPVTGNQTFTAAAYDAGNNPITGLTFTWSLANPAAGSINASTGAFSAGTVAGSYPDVVRATSGAVTGTASVTVTPGPLHHITVSPASVTVQSGSKQTFTAQGYDAFNNPVPGLTYSWSVTNANAGPIDASTGEFTAGRSSGTFANVIRASSGAVAGLATVTVEVPSPPLSLIPAENNVWLGQTFTLTIRNTSVPGQPVSGIDAFVNYDPARLEVQDADPTTPGVQIAPATGSGNVLNNVVDAVAGHIDYSWGVLPGSTPPAGAFDLATITFRGKAVTAGPSPIAFSMDFPRVSIVDSEDVPIAGVRADSAAVITYDVPLALTPSTNTVSVGDVFTVNLSSTAPAGTSITAIDAYIDFDPAYLEVVDADPLAAGIQVVAGAALNSVLGNSVDNGAGHINFSAGKLSGTPPSGAFPVATITFHAKASTGGSSTPVRISLTEARLTTAALSGELVRGVHADSQVTVAAVDQPVTITGHVTLQGGMRPSASRVVPITLKRFAPGANVITDTPLASYVASTVDTGSNAVTFQVGGIPAGTYDVTVVSTHMLVNVKRSVSISASAATVDFGTVLEGNANDDTIINALDFSILASAYMRSTGQIGFDARADFDMTGAVNALDFSLLASNYMKSSPLVAA